MNDMIDVYAGQQNSATPHVLLTLRVQQGVLHVLDCMYYVSYLSSFLVPSHVHYAHRGCSIWVGMSGIFCIILPLWESREEMLNIVKSVFNIRRKTDDR